MMLPKLVNNILISRIVTSAKITAVNSLLTDTFMRWTPLWDGHVPTIFSRIPYIETLYKTDTSIRRTTDTLMVIGG